MAKIAFFTERLPSNDDDISLFSGALIQSLADQQHDIRIFTTDDGCNWPTPHSRIEIVRPFRKWSWWETAKLIPMLAVDSPEIIHIIQPRHQSLLSFGPSPLNFVSALSTFPTKPRIVLSLYEIDNRSLDKLRPTLQIASLILVRTQAQKAELESDWQVLSSRIAVIPALALPAFSDFESESLPETLSSLIELTDRYVFVPGGLDQHSDLDTLFKILSLLAQEDEGLNFVLQGSWSDLAISKRADWQAKFKNNSAAGRTLLTGALSESTESFLFKNAPVVLLATLNPNKLKFWKHSRRALSFGSPLVLASSQVTADELDWSEMGATLNGNSVSEIASACLSFLNNEDLRIQARNQAVELADRQVTDQPANHLTRLYLELLNKR